MDKNQILKNLPIDFASHWDSHESFLKSEPIYRTAYRENQVLSLGKFISMRFCDFQYELISVGGNVF